MAITRGHARNAGVTPLDQRLMDMGRYVSNSDGSPRVGILGAANPTLVSLTAAVGPMTVNIAAAEFVTSKGKADGVMLPTNDGVVSLPLGAAPGSNSLIRSIWVKQNDSTTGDANSTPVFGYTDGAAAATPSAPTLATGQLEIAQLRIYAGTTSSNGTNNTVTQTAPLTVARGGVVPFRSAAERNAWTNAVAGQLGQIIGDSAIYRFDGAAWTSNKKRHRRIAATAQGSLTVANGYIDLAAAVTIPAAPFGTDVQYMISVTATSAAAASAAGQGLAIRVLLNGALMQSNGLDQEMASAAATVYPKTVARHVVVSPNVTHSVEVEIAAVGGTVSVVAPGSESCFVIELEPIESF